MHGSERCLGSYTSLWSPTMSSSIIVETSNIGPIRRIVEPWDCFPWRAPRRAKTLISTGLSELPLSEEELWDPCSPKTLLTEWLSSLVKDISRASKKGKIKEIKKNRRKIQKNPFTKGLDEGRRAYGNPTRLMREPPMARREKGGNHLWQPYKTDEREPSKKDNEESWDKSIGRPIWEQSLRRAKVFKRPKFLSSFPTNSELQQQK